MFSHRLRYLFITGLGIYSYLNAVFAQVFPLYHIRAPWYISMVAMVMITLAVWELNRLMITLLQSTANPELSWKKLLANFAIGSVLAVLSAIMITTMMGVGFADYSISELHLAYVLTILYATRINLFLHTLHAIFSYVSAYKQKEVEAESLHRISIQAQLQAIRNQVNPHFLFNNLNVLSSLVIRDNPEANEFVEAFSKVYRNILNTQQEELVSLARELDYIEPYIFLLTKRFPESLTVTVRVSKEYSDMQVVPGGLQMLIENAIKHNVVSKKHPLIIDISVNGMKQLVVSNNLQRKAQPEASTRLGLRNIADRYLLTTGKNIVVTEGQDFFTVQLPLIETVTASDHSGR